MRFIGIDMGKASFDLSIYSEEKTYSYPNTKLGFLRCLKEHKDAFAKAFVVIEATGGYEKALLLFLVSRNIAVCQANPRKVKFFVRSFGTQAKTDKLDAKALACYAFERHSSLSLYKVKDDTLEKLSKYIKRRQELVSIRTQEKNRASGPDRSILRQNSKLVIVALDKAIAQVDRELEQLQSHELLKEKHQTLKHIAGIGDKVALTLLAHMPELGSISNKQVASLAGVAPHPQQSGQSNGYRRTCGGRSHIKPMLFIAAMTASRSKSELGKFYKRLTAVGKKPIVALVAVMRKIIVIANAKIRDLHKQNIPLTT